MECYHNVKIIYSVDNIIIFHISVMRVRGYLIIIKIMSQQQIIMVQNHALLIL